MRTGAGRRDFLTIDGMFCAACAASVEAVLNRQPCVDAASVNFAADAAVIEWSPGGEDRQRLIEVVRGLGYRARFIGDGGDQDEREIDPGRDLSRRLIVAVVFGMWAMLPSITLYLDDVRDPSARVGLAWAAAAFSLPVILYSGWPFYRMGITTLRHRIPGVDALVLLGVAGAVLLSLIALARGSAEVYFEVAVALVTLQLVARLLDLRVRRRARDAVISLFDLAPTTVRVVQASGLERNAVLKDVDVGARIRVRPGERISVDGLVIEGSAQLDRSLMSGETTPVLVEAADPVRAGERVLDGVLTLEVTAAAGKRRIDELGRQVRRMLAQKPAWQRAVDTAAGHFIWIAVVAAMLGAALVLANSGTVFEAGVRALTVFVIACPCALSLAAPLAGLVAAGVAARNGVILRDLNAITTAAVPNRVFLDKTGTITVGAPSITRIHPANGYGPADVLRLAAAAERDSDHPIAVAIKAAKETAGASAATATTPLAVDNGQTRVVPGHGVIRTGPRGESRVGQIRWLAHAGIDLPSLPPTDTTRVGVALDGLLVGAIDLEDQLRPGMHGAIEQLRARGMEPMILSGDADEPVARIARDLGVPALAGQTPENKTRQLEEAKRAGKIVAFAGDGLNDAPALAAADLGIAVGQSTDAARTAAAIALIDADATSLPQVFELTGRTRRVIRQNLTWAVAYNALAIPAALVGWVHPAIAALAMALSSISIVLNALRIGRVRPRPAVAKSPSGSVHSAARPVRRATQGGQACRKSVGRAG